MPGKRWTKEHHAKFKAAVAARKIDKMKRSAVVVNPIESVLTDWRRQREKLDRAISAVEDHIRNGR